MTVLDEKCCFQVNDNNRTTCLEQYQSKESPGLKCLKAKGGTVQYVVITVGDPS